MDSKTKLYVFTRIEVFLIFIFMICISVTSFLLGVKVGDHYSFFAAGFKPEDKERVLLLSKKEEELKKIESMEITEQKSEEIEGQLNSKLADEFSPTSHNNSEGPQSSQTNQVGHTSPGHGAEGHGENLTPTSPPHGVENSSPNSSGQLTLDKKPEGSVKSQGKLKGMFTVQLSSHRAIKDAEDFALGFKARGYSPIIAEYIS